MSDIIATTGKALKSVGPSLRHLETTIVKQSRPLLKTLGRLDAATLAKAGGGVAAFAAIFFAAQSLLGSSKTPSKASAAKKAPAKRAAPKRSSTAKAKSRTAAARRTRAKSAA